MMHPFKLFSGPKFRVGIKLCVSIGLLLWLFTYIDTDRLLNTLFGVPPEVLLGSLALYLTATAVGTLKWSRLVSGHAFRRLFKLQFVAQFYALLLPGQIAGEVVKAHKLIKYRHDPKAIISSILFDRITGWIALLMMGLLGLLGSQTAGIAALKSRFFLALGVLIVCVLLIKSEVPDKLIQRFADTLPKFAIKLRPAGRILAGMLAVCRTYLQKPFLLLQVICLGLVFHLLGAGIFFLLCRGFDVHVTFLDLCWIFAAISMILLLPVAAGGIGLREGGLVVMLGWLSVPAEKAMAVSLSFFALQVLAGIIGALLEWRPERIKMADQGRLPKAAGVPVRPEPE